VCGWVGVWVCGCVGVWVCGCVGVWVCGCVCVCPLIAIFFQLHPPSDRLVYNSIQVIWYMEVSNPWGYPQSSILDIGGTEPNPSFLLNWLEINVGSMLVQCWITQNHQCLLLKPWLNQHFCLLNLHCFDLVSLFGIASRKTYLHMACHVPLKH